jgi:hypothetical protein
MSIRSYNRAQEIALALRIQSHFAIMPPNVL